MITELEVWIRLASPGSSVALTLTRCQVASGSLVHAHRKSKVNSNTSLFLIMRKDGLLMDKVTFGMSTVFGCGR